MGLQRAWKEMNAYSTLIGRLLKELSADGKIILKSILLTVRDNGNWIQLAQHRGKTAFTNTVMKIIILNKQ
jgi:hypothetical protein